MTTAHEKLTAAKARLQRLSFTFSNLAYDSRSSGERQARLDDATAIDTVLAELKDAQTSICAFAGPWAATYARDMGLPDGALHFTHYDILEKAGARMVDFTRHVPVLPNEGDRS